MDLEIPDKLGTGSPTEAIASTTAGHVGLELYEGDIRGATEALVVDGAGDVGCAAVGIGGTQLLGTWGTVGGGIVGGLGGCIVGSIAASETAQALWDAVVGKDTDMADPMQTLNELKQLGIDRIPETVMPDMPQSLKDLVYYRNKVEDAGDTLNESAQALSRNPQEVQNYLQQMEQENAATDSPALSSDFSRSQPVAATAAKP